MEADNDVMRQIAAANEGQQQGLYGASSYGASTGGGGWADQLGAIAAGYLSRRVDVDIQRRMATSGTVGLAGDQRPIYSTPGVSLVTAGGTLNLSSVLPLALLALAAFVVVRKL